MSDEGREKASEAIPPAKRFLAWVKATRAGDDDARGRVVAAIRAAIDEVGADQPRVAKRLGVSLRTLSYLLSGGNDARALGLGQCFTDVEW